MLPKLQARNVSKTVSRNKLGAGEKPSARSTPCAGHDAGRHDRPHILGALFGLDAINGGYGRASHVAAGMPVASMLLPDGVVTAPVGGAAAVAARADRLRPRPDRFACADGTIVNFVDASSLMAVDD